MTVHDEDEDLTQALGPRSKATAESPGEPPVRLLALWVDGRRDQQAASRIMARFRARNGSAEDSPSRRAETPPLSLEGRSRWWIPVTVAASLAVVLLVVSHRRPVPPPALQFLVDGTAGRWAVEGDNGLPAPQLTAGARWKLTSGEARLRLEPHLTVGARDGLDVEVAVLAPLAGTGRRISLRQHRGTGVYHLAPGSGWTLDVSVPGGRVEVTGTKFRIVVGEGTSGVWVGEGTVRVALDGTATPVDVPSSHHLQIAGAVSGNLPQAFNKIVDPDFALGGATRLGVSR